VLTLREMTMMAARPVVAQLERAQDWLPVPVAPFVAPMF
jgi:hypothetical protein